MCVKGRKEKKAQAGVGITYTVAVAVNVFLLHVMIIDVLLQLGWMQLNRHSHGIKSHRVG